MRDYGWRGENRFEDGVDTGEEGDEKETDGCVLVISREL